MVENPAQTEVIKKPEAKKSIIAQATEKIKSLLSEMKEKLGKKPEAQKEDKDAGYDENNLPKYVQDIDNGINPQQ